MTNLNHPTVLVIDDVSPMVRMIELEPKMQGYETESVLIGQAPIEKAESLRPDAIVLGSTLPSPQVYEVLVQLKRRVEIPVLFLHAGGNDSDGALALEMGADDTLAQPFKPEDLSFRLAALLNHKLREAQQVHRGPLIIDTLHQIVWNGALKRSLGTSEWGLFLKLLQSEGPVPAVPLLNSVWGPEYEDQLDFLRLWIERLRTNLGDDPARPSIILGDHESGYYLVP